MSLLFFPLVYLCDVMCACNADNSYVLIFSDKNGKRSVPNVLW